MSIRIREEKCIGCGLCSKECPGSLISIKDQKAHIDYPKNCWGCASCVKECKAGAIEFFLGADVGGTGSYVNVVNEKDILHWVVHKSDGSVQTIDVCKKNSNKY